MQSRPSEKKSAKKRSRLVVDTGVLVSAFVFGGTPAKAVRKAFNETDIFVSPNLLSEYRSVPIELEAKGKISHVQFKALISSIAAFVANAIIVQPMKKVILCRDPKDDMLLECCIAARARFLISGDKDLLALKEVPFNLKIMAPREFLEFTL